MRPSRSRRTDCRLGTGSPASRHNRTRSSSVTVSDPAAASATVARISLPRLIRGSRASTACAAETTTRRCWKHIAMIVRASRSVRAHCAASTIDRAADVHGGLAFARTSSRGRTDVRCTRMPVGVSLSWRRAGTTTCTTSLVNLRRPRSTNADSPPSSEGRPFPAASDAAHNRCPSESGPLWAAYTPRCTLDHRPPATFRRIASDDRYNNACCRLTTPSCRCNNAPSPSVPPPPTAPL